MKSLLESTQDTEAAIKDLRKQKIESKLYHLRCKVLPKQMKKLKTTLTQRIAKKPPTECVGDELAKAKSLDHVRLANWAFKVHVVKKDSYLCEKLQEYNVEVFNEESCDEFVKLQSIKSFQDAVKATRSDLTTFMRKLLHEEIQQVVPKPKTPTTPEPLKADKSYFIGNLNEEAEVSDNGLFEGYSSDNDDLEEDGEDCHDATIPKKKKNRLGQVARRRLAEQKFGQEAKHIKSGGLTVQQREALRKQKSDQRKDRLARIKKETSKKSESSARKNDSLSKNPDEPIAAKPAIKIDPSMHPSWAAKLQQQQKASSASFQGQKIKFDD
jgi:hypothetical protein